MTSFRRYRSWLMLWYSDPGMESPWATQHHPGPRFPASSPSSPWPFPQGFSSAQSWADPDMGSQQSRASTPFMVVLALVTETKSWVSQACRLTSAVNNDHCSGPILCVRCFVQVIHTLCLGMSESGAPSFTGTQDTRMLALLRDESYQPSAVWRRCYF